jgi:hypothetical protein
VRQDDSTRAERQSARRSWLHRGPLPATASAVRSLRAIERCRISRTSLVNQLRCHGTTADLLRVCTQSVKSTLIDVPSKDLITASGAHPRLYLARISSRAGVEALGVDRACAGSSLCAGLNPRHHLGTLVQHGPWSGLVEPGPSALVSQLRQRSQRQTRDLPNLRGLNECLVHHTTPVIFTMLLGFKCTIYDKTEL